MIEHIGYYRKGTYNAVNDAIRLPFHLKLKDKLPLYKDKIPTDKDGDCIRVTLIDGTLLIEKWVSEYRDFELVACTSNFIIEYCK